jgi:hypothetical protein
MGKPRELPEAPRHVPAEWTVSSSGPDHDSIVLQGEFGRFRSSTGFSRCAHIEAVRLRIARRRLGQDKRCSPREAGRDQQIDGPETELERDIP